MLRAQGRQAASGSLLILSISPLPPNPSRLSPFFFNPSPRSGMVLLGQGFQSNKVNQGKMTEWKPKIERILMRTCLGSTPKLITIMCFSCSQPFGPLFMHAPNCIWLFPQNSPLPHRKCFLPPVTCLSPSIVSRRKKSLKT